MEEEMWSLSDAPQETSSDERINTVEAEADRNLEQREQEEKDNVKRLRRDRENADSREKWQKTGKEAKEISGELSKSERKFAMPHATVFGSRGRSNAFKTADKRRRLERFLGRNTNVSTRDRKTYIGALECFRNRRDGTLNILGMKKMNKFLRTGHVGGDRDVKRAFDEMKQKGIIKDVKDVRKLVGRGAMRKMRQAMTRKADAMPGPSAGSHEGSRPGVGAGPSSPRRP